MVAKLSIVGENHYDAQKADFSQPLPWLLIFCIDREQTPAGFNPSGYRPLRPQNDDFLITLLPPSLHQISPSLSFSLSLFSPSLLLGFPLLQNR